MRSYRGKILRMALATVLAGALPLAGQDAPEGSTPAAERDVIYIQRTGPPPAGGASDFFLFAEGEDGVPVPAPPPPGPSEAPIGPAISFVSAVGAFGGNTVTGAPYSAEAETEIEQRLADGNRIVRRTTATIYRDSEGRTRRDQTLGAIGPWVVGGDSPHISSINDPVAKVRYLLDHTNKIAHKMPSLPGATLTSGPGGQVQIRRRVRANASAGPGEGAGMAVVSRRIEPASRGGQIAPQIEPFELPVPPPPGAGLRPGTSVSLPEPRTESLGTQLIEGVEAEGTRSISTIPAGAIGNDFAIEIVTERWYSPELQTVVLSLHKDPRVGETTYRLSNIQRTEPARSLFEIPEGYQLIQPGVPGSPPSSAQ